MCVDACKSDTARVAARVTARAAARVTARVSARVTSRVAARVRGAGGSWRAVDAACVVSEAREQRGNHTAVVCE